MTCDIQSLLDDAKCFANLSPQQLQVVIVQLLCDITDAI